MDCAEEVTLLRRELGARPGIQDLRFDVAIGKLTVDYDSHKIEITSMGKVVERTGMRLELWTDDVPETQGSFWERHKRSAFPALSGLAILAAMIAQADDLGEFFMGLVAHDDHHHHEGMKPLAIFCYAMAIVLGLWQVVPKAMAALRMRRAEMNLLVLVSMAGAVALGEWSEGATLAFLFSLAGLLESWSMKRAQTSVSALMRTRPREACVVHKHGDHEHERLVGVDKIADGALVRVRPGETIPCDGEIVAGSSPVNQAIITGESMPVSKVIGDKVFAGSMNGEGLLDIRVTGTVADHAITRIARMVSESAGQRRAQSEQFIERLARYYTPAVLALAFTIIAGGTLFGPGGFDRWLYQGILVLLIACPCALVISTPVTVAAALASAASRGVVVKGGAFLEEAAAVRAVVFDKTGVLTRGEPEVREFLPVNGQPREHILQRLTALESRSEHPVAKAVVRFGMDEVAGDLMPPVEEFHARSGRGAEGKVGVELFWAGNNRLLLEKHLETAEVRRELDKLEGAEYTAFVCGTDREVWAVVGLQDPVRDEAQAGLDALRATGVERLVLLTGDNEGAADVVSRKLLLDESHSGLLPEDKTKHIQDLRSKYGTVAMVGDGINDAPAMAAASMGVALGGSATDVALESADVVLMNNDLRKLAFLVRHSKRAARVIRENVGIALGLKAVFLVAAFFDSASLWMAIAADMGATLLVTFNGLRMLRARE